jgi:prepilin-type N-terminal cleavage/methylation domain-containing protein
MGWKAVMDTMRTSKVGVYTETGFTLIELAMVIVVIGIVTALAMPRVGGMFERQQMRRTINAIRGYARYLQAFAAVEKCVYRLTFDLDQRVIAASMLQTTACPGQTRRLPDYVLPATVHILDVVTPEGEKIADGIAMTHFFPTGYAQPSTIHLSGTSTNTVTLMIEPLTGRVQVFEGYVEHQAG